MKKTLKMILAILVLIVILVSLTACGKTDVEKPVDDELVDEKNREESNTNNEQSNGYSNTKTGKFYSQFKDGKMTIEYEMESEGKKMKVISITNGEKIYTETFVDERNMDATVIDKDNIYAVDHTNRAIVKIENSNADINMIATNIINEKDINMDKLKKGSKEINGKKYETEEWLIDEVKTTMCFEGDDLIYIVSSVEGKEINIKVLKASTEIEEDLFEAVSNYELIEL